MQGLGRSSDSSLKVVIAGLPKTECFRLRMQNHNMLHVQLKPLQMELKFLKLTRFTLGKLILLSLLARGDVTKEAIQVVTCKLQGLEISSVAETQLPFKCGCL